MDATALARVIEHTGQLLVQLSTMADGATAPESYDNACSAALSNAQWITKILEVEGGLLKHVSAHQNRLTPLPHWPV